MSDKPLIKRYKKGSVIFFQGDPVEDQIYILRRGVLTSYFTSADSCEEVSEPIKIGEFFGVKSVLGRYPREQTVQAVTDCEVLVFSEMQFMNLTKQNVGLIMTMLRVFSNQLRKNGKKIKILLSKNVDGLSPEFGLYNIGEFYMKKKNKAQAVYAFTKYMDYYPAGEKAGDVRAKLAKLGGVTSAPTPAPSKLNISETETDTTKIFFTANAMTREGKYKEAVPLFIKVAGIQNPKQTEADLQKKSLFELGRCYLQTDQAADAQKVFTAYVTKYPQDDLVKTALLYIGDATLKAGDREKAKQFYQKVMNTPPKDQVNEMAESRLSRLS